VAGLGQACTWREEEEEEEEEGTGYSNVRGSRVMTSLFHH